MKNALFIVLFSLVAINSVTAQDELVVDPNATMRQLSGSFSKIRVSNGIDLYLSQSDKEAVAVSASEEKYSERIQTVIEGSTLKIYYDGGQLSWKPSGKKLKVYISFKSLNELEASGASDIFVQGVIKSPNLILKLSGASDFSGAVKSDDLVMDISGASDVKINGTATVVHIDNSGASDVKGYGLEAETCTTKSSGASDVNITVTKELTVDASGASDVSYMGTAVLTKSRSSGASTVAKKDR